MTYFKFHEVVQFTRVSLDWKNVLSQYLVNIQSLDLSYYKRHHLTLVFQSLSRLTLAQRRKTGRPVRGVLKALTLDFCQGIQLSKSFLVDFLPHHAASLRLLSLNGIFRLREAELEVFSRSCHQLQTLNVANAINHYTDDRVLCNMIRNNPHLVRLNLKDVSCASNRIVDIITSTCPKLERLDISHGKDASVCTAMPLCTAFYGLTKLHYLTELKLSGRCLDEGRCVVALAKSDPRSRLKTLALANSSWTEENLLAPSQVLHQDPGHPWHDIAHLDISNILRFVDHPEHASALASFMHEFTNLHTLDLALLEQLDDHVLDGITGNNWTTLTDLILTGTGVTTLGLTHTVTRCVHLTYLVMGRCTRVRPSIPKVILDLQGISLPQARILQYEPNPHHEDGLLEF